MLFQILHVSSHFVASPFSVMSVRLKNGQTLKDDYRIKQRNDALIIRGVTEMDAGNYTIVLTNKITKEEQRRSFQLLVNSMYSLLSLCNSPWVASCCLSRDSGDKTSCILPQFVLTLSRKRWPWTLTCTHTAAAPPWGALLVDSPHLHASTGSGRLKRTVQMPLSKTTFVSVCEKERK